MLPCPLRLFFLAHPQSIAGCRLAECLMRRFVEPPASGGLRIPTYFTPDRGDDLPPPWEGEGGINLDLAEHTLVVLLADTRMVRLVSGGTGQAWRDFFAEGLRRVPPSSSPHYVLAFALDSDAYNLASQVNMIPLKPELPPKASTEALDQWLEQVTPDSALHIAIRAIQKLDPKVVPAETTTARSPIQLFLSHAKADLADDEHDPVRFVESDVQELPIDYWFDAADIPPSKEFEEEIAKGIQDCSIVVSFQTDHYSSRPWCQREILDAKRFAVPILVVDALKLGEPRNFPYLGNLPTIHWSGDEPKREARKIVSRAARETLRYMHNRRILAQAADAGEVVIASAPEALTLAHQAGSSSSPPRFIYPDPPLSEQELSVLNALLPTATFSTPLSKLAHRVPKPAPVLAVSISNSGDLSRFGLSEQHEQTLSDEIHLYLLLAGCQIAYGGSLEPRFDKASNFTLRLFELVRSYSILANATETKAFAPIQNYAPWPLHLAYDDAVLSLFGQIAELISCPRPPEAEVPERDEELFPITSGESRTFPSDTPERRFAWARALTAMRIQMTKAVTARVVIGGRLENYAGLCPGIIEEAWMSIVTHQPLYLIGAFGGAARTVIDTLITGDAASVLDACCPLHLSECIELSKKRNIEIRDGSAPTERLQLESRLVLSEQIAADIVQAGKGGIAGALNNGLDDDMNCQLFQATEPTVIAGFILRGLLNCTN